MEDDERIAEPLVFGLRAEGFTVVSAADGNDALRLARAERPDLVLLDIMIPGIDGFAVCRTLRKESSVPVIMLTARGEELDRVMGLELGADDYIVKPFSFRELLARVRAILRRRALDRGEAATKEDRFVADGLTIDRVARQVWVNGQEIELRQREFDLLRMLTDHAGTALPRQQLLDGVWGASWIGDPHTLDVHIRWLREKIEENPSAPRHIQTVRGFGYRFAVSSAPKTDAP